MQDLGEHEIGAINVGAVIDRARQAFGASSDAELSKLIGKFATTITNFRSRGTLPFKEFIALAHTKQVSLEWLFFGVGEDAKGGGVGESPPPPYKEAPPIKTIVRDHLAEAAAKGVLGPRLTWGGPSKSPAEKLAEEGFALVPRYDVQGSMGGGALIHSEQVVDHLAFRTEWVRSELRANPANLVLISAVGDSMEPSLSSGDLLLVDKSEYKIRDDAIYVISVNGSLLVKRVQLLLDGTVIIRSDNSAYQPQTVKQPDIEDLKVVGRVVWVGRRV